MFFFAGNYEFLKLTLTEVVKYGVHKVVKLGEYGREKRKRKKTEFIFPSENQTQTNCFTDVRNVHCTTLIRLQNSCKFS